MSEYHYGSFGSLFSRFPQPLMRVARTCTGHRTSIPASSRTTERTPCTTPFRRVLGKVRWNATLHPGRDRGSVPWFARFANRGNLDT